jgi:hypothetical protein
MRVTRSSSTSSTCTSAGDEEAMVIDASLDYRRHAANFPCLFFFHLQTNGLCDVVAPSPLLSSIVAVTPHAQHTLPLPPPSLYEAGGAQSPLPMRAPPK